MTQEPVYMIRVDGSRHLVCDAAQNDSLTHVLREHLGVTEVKNGCDTGRCGSCVIRLDGVLVTSCTVLAADAAECDVRTVRSVGTAERPGRVQRALAEAGAVQCGYCIPGMAVAIDELLSRNPAPEEQATRLALSGNLCRCTGYGRIVEAVRQLAAGVAVEST